MIDHTTNLTVGPTSQNCFFPVPYYPQVPPVITVPLPMVYPAMPTQLSLADLEQIRALVREEVHKALHPEQEEAQ